MVAGAVTANAAEDYNKVTYTLNKAASPTADQQDAYDRITKAMDAATARWNKWSFEHPADSVKMHLTVNYKPGVPTAQAHPAYGMNEYGWKSWGSGSEGTIDFGSNKGFMVEGTALHEIGHNMGSGYFQWQSYCVLGRWTGPAALETVKSFGDNEALSCGSAHMWPYGDNYATEWTDYKGGADEYFNRSVAMFAAMRKDAINPKPYFTVQTMADADQNKAYDQTLRLAGQSNQGDLIKVSLKSGALPKGIELDPTDTNKSDDLFQFHIKGIPEEAGTFKFTLEAQNDQGIQDQDFTLKVNPTPIEGVTINNPPAELKEGKTSQFSATVTPANTGEEVIWSSSDPTVATVSEDGLVTAVKEGKTVITATVADKKADFTLTVTKKPDQGNGSSGEIKPGQDGNGNNGNNGGEIMPDQGNGNNGNNGGETKPSQGDNGSSETKPNQGSNETTTNKSSDAGNSQPQNQVAKPTSPYQDSKNAQDKTNDKKEFATLATTGIDLSKAFIVLIVIVAMLLGVGTVSRVKK